jgi:hypothetical protein
MKLLSFIKRLRRGADRENTDPANRAASAGTQNAHRENGAHHELDHGAARKWLLRLVSAWLLFHVAAIIIAPASVSPSSSLAQAGWRMVRPYVQVLYLNHGYHFFAPEPAESTLVSYTVERDDGTVTSGRFPNREIFPRLLYHRHFMLTEFLSYTPLEEQEVWHRAYARNLCRKHGGQRVSLTQVTHYLPTLDSVEGQVRLDDPASFAEAPMGTFESDDL